MGPYMGGGGPTYAMQKYLVYISWQGEGKDSASSKHLRTDRFLHSLLTYMALGVLISSP